MVTKPRAKDLLLISDASDADEADRVQRLLESAGIRVIVDTTTRAGPDLGDQLRAALGDAAGIAVMIGVEGLTDAIRAAAELAERATPIRPLFVLQLRGASEGLVRSLPVPDEQRVDLTLGLDDADTASRLVRSMQAVLNLDLEEPTAPAKGDPPAPVQSSNDVAEAGDSASETESTTDVLGQIFSRLDESALEALGNAEALRRALAIDKIHMEQLLNGLYHESSGLARKAIEAAGVTEAEFQSILNNASSSDVPDVKRNEVVALDALPPLSTHVREALDAAASLADKETPPEIQSRHVFAGALAIKTCGPVKELLARGVPPDLVPLPTPFSIEAVAQADEPTRKDLIGYRKIVNSLAELLTDDSTTFPLTIAVSAPWGGGKSSIMRMLGQELDEHPHGPEWLAVDFPAWRYETGEQLWAAMAKATYDAGLKRLGFLDRQLFRLRLEIERGSVTRAGLRIGAAVAATVIGAFLGSQAAKAAGVEQGAGVAFGGAGGFIAVAQALWSSFVDPFKKAVESFAEKPGIRSGDGFTADAASQVDALMAQLLANGGRVAIFIDDLDRCTPRNLVRVIEAVNQIFIAGTTVANMPHPESRLQRLTRRLRRWPGAVPEHSRLVFILGMDRHVVARGIEAEYAALKDRLDKEGDPAGLDYGLAFLDKIVQLWVTLPPPTYAELTTLLGSVAGIDQAGGLADEAAVRTQRRELEVAAATLPEDDRAGRAAIVRDHRARAEPEQAGATRRAGEDFLAETRAPAAKNSPLIWAAMQEGLKHLDRNPRQVKRYNNAFRLQLSVAARSDRMTFAPQQLAALARWVAIRLRWGALARDIDEEPGLLTALEQTASGATVSDPELEKRKADWFDLAKFPDLPDLLAALRVEKGEQRLSTLPFEDFLPIA